MKYSIVGGGVSGLSAAYYLAKHVNPSLITVYEASNRVGGWIEATKTEDGHIYEHGPRTIRPAGKQGANTLRLIEELGLEGQLRPILYGHPATVKRLVLKDGELHCLPSSLKKAFFKQPPFSRPLVMAGLRDLFTRQKKCEDEPLFDFVARRFGHDVASYAIDPLVRGVCAGNARNISAKAFVAGPMFELEQKYGGIMKGMMIESLPWNRSKDEHEPSVSSRFFVM